MMHSMQSVVLASLLHVPQQCCTLQEEHLSCMCASAWTHLDRAAVGMHPCYLRLNCATIMASATVWLAGLSPPAGDIVFEERDMRSVRFCFLSAHIQQHEVVCGNPKRPTQQSPSWPG